MCENVSTGDKVRMALGFPIYFMSSYVGLFLDRFGTIHGAVANWHDAVLVYFGLAPGAKIMFRNGESMQISKENFSSFLVLSELYSMPPKIAKKADVRHGRGGVSLLADGKRLRLRPDSAFSVAYQFYYGEYKDMDLTGRDVVDIGAYVADTPLYYSIRCKARHVYGYEPVPYLYEVGAGNVDANGMRARITMLNEAVAGKDGFTFVDSGSTNFGYVGKEARRGLRKRIPMVSLNTVAKRYKLDHAMLKMDCEGGEYDIISNATSETLRRFDIMNIEYHYGYSNLVERLEREGFRVTYGKPAYIFKGMGKKPMVRGYLVAKRK